MKTKMCGVLISNPAPPLRGPRSPHYADSQAASPWLKRYHLGGSWIHPTCEAVGSPLFSSLSFRPWKRNSTPSISPSRNGDPSFALASTRIPSAVDWCAFKNRLLSDRFLNVVTLVSKFWWETKKHKVANENPNVWCPYFVLLWMNTQNKESVLSEPNTQRFGSIRGKVLPPGFQG